jgi:serralysin
MSISPTNHEQYMLELINRARANPNAEVQRNVDVNDLNQGLSPGTISTSAKQPLAFSLSLIDASRKHSQWMLDVDKFSHTGINGSSPGDRMQAAGYSFTGSWTWGEIFLGQVHLALPM